MDSRIESVAIVGDGIVGWSAAAALRRNLPYLKVTLLPLESAKDDLANHLTGTLPSIVGFHGDIGLGDEDTVARAGSALRLGARMSGWVEGAPPFILAYGKYGETTGGSAFHQLWLRAAAEGAPEPFERYSLEAQLARSGRAGIPTSDSTVGELAFGLQIDPETYLDMMRAYALHLGVGTARSDYVDVRLDGATGFIASAVLADGSDIQADLFVDCTGPSAQVRSRLGDAFEDWAVFLPCDRVTLGTLPAAGNLPPADELAATPVGWTWQASNPRFTSVGISYASGFADESKALAELPSDIGAVRTFALRQGFRSDPWRRNCVAIGGAAMVAEPLHFTNLHLVHSAIDRIINMMPGRDCAEIELAEYNRQTAAEAMRVRDFLCMHYVTARRPQPFWAAASGIALPDSLAHTLSLYRERGRFPFFEEETFARDTWIAVLIGRDVRPSRLDPLAEALPAEAVRQSLSRMRDSVDNMVGAAPAHEQFLSSFYQRVLR